MTPQAAYDKWKVTGFLNGLDNKTQEHTLALMYEDIAHALINFNEILRVDGGFENIIFAVGRRFYVNVYEEDELRNFNAVEFVTHVNRLYGKYRPIFANMSDDVELEICLAIERELGPYADKLKS